MENSHPKTSPSPELAAILRTTLQLVEYYAGPCDLHGSIPAMRSAIQRVITELDAEYPGLLVENR
jgi:hypothetical protein